MAVLTRTEWVNLRDKVHKEKKGAVSGVSMGDALDAYHKEDAKGLEAAIKAAPKLKAAADKYSKGCKNDGLKKDIKEKIVDKLAAVEKCLPFVNDVKAVRTAWEAFKKKPSPEGLKAVSRLLGPIRDDGRKTYPMIKDVETVAHNAWKWMNNEPVEYVVAHASDIDRYLKDLSELR